MVNDVKQITSIIFLPTQYPRFMQLLIDMSVEAVEGMEGSKIDTKTIKFLKTPYKGKVHPSIIREKKSNSEV